TALDAGPWILLELVIRLSFRPR
ncbi:MAG: hypothetical protein QOD62_1673, partial [Actinomycetota bacterium]|nr:hypothetical protein [Actinomycetota bacterium]